MTPRPSTRRPARRLATTLATTLAATLLQAAAAAAEPVAAGTLPTITVTATLAEQDARSAPASVTVVGEDELRQGFATDLLQALRGVPGLTLGARQVGGRKTLALRGLDGRHTLMLIDGRRISASDDVVGHSDYQYGWLPMAAIERVEVIRGPMSALYGSEALGGVVNIVTRTPRERWQGTVSAAGALPLDGDDGRQGRLAVHAGGPLSATLNLRVSAELLNLQAVPLAEDPRQSELEARRLRSGAAVAGWQVAPGQSLEAGLSVVDEERAHDALSGTRAYRSRYDLDRRQAHLGWRGRFGQGPARMDGQLRAYRSEIDITNQRDNGVAATRPQFLQDDVVDGHLAWRLGGHRLTAGGEWREELLRNAGLTGGQDDATHRALFVQDEWALSSALVLTAGLRRDHHEFFGEAWSPRAYLVWAPGGERGWVFKGGAGRAFKAPTLKQVSPNYVGAEGPHTFLGNGAVRPERARSFEFGADGPLGPLGLRATWFDTAVDQLITHRLIATQGTRRTYRYDNVDAARIRGLELGLQAALAPGWQAGLDLTWLRTRDESTGRPLADRPRQVLQGQLDWQPGDGWSARLTLQHTGRQQASDGVLLPAYALAQVAVGRRLRLGAQVLQLSAGIENLGALRLAEKSASFGWAEAPRRLHASAQLSF